MGEIYMLVEILKEELTYLDVLKLQKTKPNRKSSSGSLNFTARLCC